MNALLIGNAISMIGCLIMVGIGFLKKKSHILIAQSVQCLFMGAGNLILGGVSGFICNVVTIIRNFAFLKFRNTTALKIFFMALQFVLSIGTLSAGWISWLPIIAGTEYSLAVFRFKNDERKLKWAFSLCIGLYTIFNFAIQNFVGAASNLFVCIATVGLLLKKK